MINVRLLIISVKEDKVYVNHDVNLFPFIEMGDEQPITLAKQILKDVCGVECLDDEFIMSKNIYNDNGTLNITYGVMIPYMNTAKTTELNEFMRHLNEMDKAIVAEMQYLL